MAEDVKGLISSAAQDDASVQTEPMVGFGDQAANDTAGVEGGAAPGGADDVGFMRDLYDLLRSSPELASRVADVIEEFINGGGKVQSAAPPAPQAAPTGAGAMPQELMALLQAIDGRVARLEKTHADMALEKELAETKQEYEKLKEHFPILPELNDKELLQLALQFEGLPLKEALYLWAMRKMQEGEGSVADRLVAARIEQSKGSQAPRVETKGGGIPAGTQEPPQNFREARRRAKEFLAAIAGGPIA